MTKSWETTYADFRNEGTSSLIDGTSAIGIRKYVRPRICTTPGRSHIYAVPRARLNWSLPRTTVPHGLPPLVRCARGGEIIALFQAVVTSPKARIVDAVSRTRPVVGLLSSVIARRRATVLASSNRTGWGLTSLRSTASAPPSAAASPVSLSPTDPGVARSRVLPCTTRPLISRSSILAKSASGSVGCSAPVACISG
jgi:hypothetical protein